MTVPIDGVRYWFDESASAFVAPGRPSLSLSRPSGPEYVAVESLFQAGDMRADGTFDLSAVLNRCPAGKIVTFPEGEFVVNNFRDDDQVFQAGILVPKHVRGIVGSGKGTLGGSTGTIFSMRPGSSTRGGGAVDRNGKLYVPVQDDVTPCQLNLVKQLDQQYPGVWKNFQVRGTDQGHIFSAMQVYNTIGANVFEDILITGWEGNAGAPPGETNSFWLNEYYLKRFAELKIDIRVDEDQTANYRASIIDAWVSFTSDAAGSACAKAYPSEAVAEVALWTRRVAALDSGALQLLRYYGIKMGSTGGSV